MIKKSDNVRNSGIILIFISIILLGGVFVYFSMRSDNSDVSLEKENVNFSSSDEKESMTLFLEDVKSSLSIITILTSIEKYNAGGDYVTKKNENLLESVSAKQLFILEIIVADYANNDNFVILNTLGDVDDDIVFPTEEGSYAYYPYDLFILEYNKYFKDEFEVMKRDVSSFMNKYDEDIGYIYYNNKRAGLNGLFIEKIVVDDIELLDKNIYSASVTLNYSDRLSSLLSVEREYATI